MIITRNELDNGKLDKEILRNIKLLAEAVTRDEYDVLVLRFKIEHIKIKGEYK